eukprot:g17144.t1
MGNSATRMRFGFSYCNITDRGKRNHSCPGGKTMDNILLVRKQPLDDKLLSAKDGFVLGCFLHRFFVSCSESALLWTFSSTFSPWD